MVCPIPYGDHNNHHSLYAVCVCTCFQVSAHTKLNCAGEKNMLVTQEIKIFIEQDNVFPLTKNTMSLWSNLDANNSTYDSM